LAHLDQQLSDVPAERFENDISIWCQQAKRDSTHALAPASNDFGIEAVYASLT
jgi:hypothetical protein